MSKKKTDYRKAGLVFEELEPRLLLSADPLAVATDAGVAIVQELVPGENEDPAAIVQSSDEQAFSSVRNELVIIDSRAPNYQQLHNDLIKAQQEGRNIHVVVLDAHRDGIEQINEAFESHNKLDAVHIVSHGDDGQLQLGATQLNKTTLHDRKAEISGWKDSFTGGGDLLIYGCKLAETADGKSLVDSLSQLTATDVAASDDLTGNKLLGGDWELEYEAGDIETQVAFSDDVQQNWQGTLEGAAPAAQQEQPVEEQQQEQQQEQQAQVELTQQQAVINEEEQAATRQEEQEQQSAIREEQRQEIVFIDESVDDYQSFIDDLQKNSDASTTLEVYLLDGRSDGVNYINDVLSEYENVDAVHIFSHGDDAAVKLGTTWLNPDNLDNYSNSLSAWSDALDANADILIYGCNLAQSEKGEQFTSDLAQLTGADVAASDDLTGHKDLGADWELEYSTGNIESRIGISNELQQSWGHVMTVAVDNSSSVSSVNTSSVTVSHTTSGTDRLMLVGISSELNSGNTVDSVTYNGVNLTLVAEEEYEINGNAHVQIWSLVAPDLGTHDVVVNLAAAGDNGVVVGVMTFTGVNQTDPLLGFVSESGKSATPSATVSSATDDLVFGILSVHDNNPANSTPDAGTEYWEVAAGHISGAAIVQAGGGVVTSSWTASSADWSVAAISIQAATNSAQTTSLSVVQDAYIQEAAPTSNDGTSGSMTVASESGSEQRSLVQYDLSSIPAGTTIQSAVLKLDATAVNGDITIDAYQLTEAWTEGSATWNESSSGTSWTTAGGAYNATPLDSRAALNGLTGSYNWDITSLAQDWVDGVEQNYGLMFSSPDGGQTWSIDFDTREGVTPPVLEIVYETRTAPIAQNDAYSVNEDTVLVSSDSWDLGGWSTRQTLSFNNAAQTENLTDFPVLIKLNSSRIDYSQTQDQGQDLRFVDADGTVLSHEIESWDETGTSYVWVKVPQIDASSGNDYIWMYYGNAGAADGQDPDGVWTEGYRAVYHLDETGTIFDDSTARDLDGSVSTGTTSVNGLIGGARDFEETNLDSIDLGADQNYLKSTSVGTLSAWINPETLTGDGAIVGIAVGGATPQSASRFSILASGDNIRVYAHSTDSTAAEVDVVTTTSPLTAGSWHYVTAVVDYANDSVDVYVDGVLQTLSGTVSFSSGTTPNTASSATAIGSNEDKTDELFDGVIDEVHIAHAARTAEWIKAEYESQRDQFITFGYQQTVAGVLGNDLDQESDTLTASLVSNVSNGTLVLNADGTFQYTPDAGFGGTDSFVYEVNDGSNNTSQATVYITVNEAPVANNDSYSVGQDQTLTLTSVSTDKTTASDLEALWNFDEGANDATANGNDGTTYGDVTWSTSTRTGDAALSFDGVDDYVETAAATLDLSTAMSFTLSAWFQTDTTAGQQHILWQGVSTENGWGTPSNESPTSSEMHLSVGHWDAANSNKITFFMGYHDLGPSSINIVSNSDFTDTLGWHNAVVVVSDLGGGKLQADLYIDGVLEGSDTGTEIDRSQWDAGFRIGQGGPAGRNFDGMIDEVAVYNRDLTSAEVHEIYASGLIANDTDADGDNLTASLVSGPSFGTLSLGGDGSSTYTPNSGFTGIDTFTYKVNDGSLDSNIATVTINVVNNTPVAMNDPGEFNTTITSYNPVSYWRLGEASGTTAIDDGGTGNSAIYNNVTLSQAGAVNGDSNTAISFDGSSSYVEIAHDDAYLIDDGTIQLWFNATDLLTSQGLISKDSSGLDTGGHFTVRLLTDGSLEVRMQSTSDDYFLYSAAGSVTAGNWHHVAVSFGSNGMELFLDGASVATNPYTGGLGTTSGGAGNYEPIAVGGSTRTSDNFSVLESPQTVPQELFKGSIDEVAIIDQQLTADQIQNIFSSAVQNYTVAENSSLVIPASEGLLINDSDAEGDALTVSLVSGPTYGALTLNADGSFTYTPNAEFSGTDTFTYLANDGINDSNIATVTITVTGDNDAPVNTVPGTQVVLEDTQTAISGITVADPDAGAGIISTRLSVTNGVLDVTLAGAATISAGANGSGSLTISGTVADINTTLASLLYTGNQNANGVAADTLTVFSNDLGNTGTGGARKDTDTVQIDITPVNDAPLAQDDSFSVDEDNVLTSNDSWVLSGWSTRHILSFNNLAQTENLTDFPVLIKLDASRIDYTKTQDQGQDLRFVDADGTVLAHEIESWDETGTSYVWVKVPQIDAASGNDYIMMYYGNGAVADGQNSAGVWTEGYRAVYHLEETGTTFGDSTTSQVDGSDVNGTVSTTGQIGSARDFDGVDDSIDLGSNQDFLNNTSLATLSAWINTDTLSGTGDILGVTVGGDPATTSSSRFGIARQGDNVHVYIRTMDDSSDTANVTTTTSPLSVGTWHLVHVVADYANDTVKMYVDGVEQSVTGTVNFNLAATPNTNSANAAIGANEGPGGSAEFDGTIDEAHIANVARSADWIAAEYASQLDNFVAFGYQQTVSGVLGNDIDPEGDTLTATLVTGTSNGALTFNADGSFVYTPDADYNGIDTFSYEVSDGNGGVDQATVTITVNAVNDAPVANDNNYVISEDQTLTINALTENASSSDLNASWQLDEGSGTTAFDYTGNGNNGTISGATWISGRTGDAALQFDGVDDYVNLGSATSIDDIFAGGGTVSAWINPAGWGENGYGRILDKSATTMSADGWALQLNGATGAIRFEHGFSTERGAWEAQGVVALGSWTHVVVSYDNSDTSNVPLIYINGVLQTVVQDASGGTPTGTASSDAAQNLYMGNFPGGTTRTFDGVMDEVGIYNRILTPAEISALIQTGIIANDTDIDGDALDAIVVSGPSNGTLALNTDGSFTYIPDADFNGTDSFTYKVNDGTADSNAATVNITVTPVNDAPAATNLFAAEFYTEDTPLNLTDIVVSDVDSANVTVTLTLSDVAAGTLSTGTSGTVTSTFAAGVWTASGAIADVNTLLAGVIFTPSLDYNSDFNIATSVSDGVAPAVTGSKSMFGTAINDRPVIDLDADDSSGSTGVDFQTSYFEGNPPVNITDADVSLIDVDNANLVSITVTLTDEIDSSGNKEILSANAGTTGLAVNWDTNLNVLTITGPGSVADFLSVLSTVTYENTRNNPTVGDRHITFVADDGTASSVIATTTVSVVQTSKAPVANDDAFTVDEGSTNTLDLAINDTDQDGDLDISSITIVSGPTNGTITAINADGTVEYVHDGSETLSDSFTYTVDDLIGATSNVATVTLTINPVNDAPVLAPIGNQTVDELATLSFTATATDPDLPGDILTFSLDAASIAAGMSIDANTGAFSWTPTEAQDGPIAVTVTVTDNGTGTLVDSETFTITVNEVNTAPVLGAIGNQTVDELATLNFTATATDADLPANTLTFSLDAASIAAGMSIDANTGAFSWTPTEAQGGSTPTVTITVTDNGTGSLVDSETFTITVNDVNTAPVLGAIGNQTVDELATLSFTATATDSDLPVDTLTFSLDAASIAAGMNIDANTGVFSWTPTEAQGGSAPSVTITVTDSGTGTLVDSETFTITVNHVNTAPVLGAIGNQTVDELATLSFTATATDPDLPADTLTFSLDAASIAAGMSIDANTGAFSWTPTEAQGGSTPSVTITVTDNGTGTLVDSETFTITVNDVNTAPVLGAIGNQTVDELATLTFTATATDSDLPADTLTFSLDAASITAGMSIDANTGVFSWTPTEAQGGSTPSVTITVTDNGTGTLVDSETFTITVNHVNTAPVLGAIGNQTVDELATLSFTATATDSDLPVDTLTFSLDAASIAAGMSIDANTGAFSWTPNGAQGGAAYPVTVTVTDSGAGNMVDSETFTITVNDVNNAPVLGAIGNQTIDELATLSFTATATDPDLPGDILTFSLDAASIAAGMSIDANTGVFSWTPTEAQDGPIAVTVTVTDNGAGNLMDSETFTITVNEVNTAPVLGAIGNQAIDELATLSFTVTATDADLPANTLTFSLDAASIAAGMSIDASTGVFSWTPTEAQGGSTPPVTITVTDNGTGSLVDSETFTITVNDVNTAPVLGAIGNQTVDELATLSFTATATDSDLPVDTLTFSLDAASIAAGMSIDASTGVFSWTPTEAQGGSTPPVTITVTDNGSGTLVDSETFTITVNHVNTAPVLGAIGNQTVDELATLSFTATATDPDLPADTLTFSLDAASIAAGMSIDASTGVFSWTPTEAQDGPVAVTVTVIDSGTGNLMDSETFTITVNEVNTAPVLGAIGNQAIDELATLSFTATATDADLPANTLTFSLDAASIAAGMSIDANTGVFSWTPTEAQGGSTPSVTITVTDNGSGNLVDSETFTITVNDVNTAPVLGAIGNQTVDELATLSFTATATDPDLPADTLTFSLDAASIAAGMSIDANTGVFSWTPTEAQGGSTPSVTVTVTDSGTGNLMDSETFTITVNDVNTAPVLGAIGNQTVDELATLSFTATATDPDLPADTLTFSLDAASIAAGMSIDANTGVFSWTPTGAQGGAVYPVTVTVTDSGAGNLVDSETFTITVYDAPVANDDSAIVDEGQSVNINLAANDTDSDGTVDISTIVITSLPANGSVVVNANGTVDYTHDGSETLADSFTYTIQDDRGMVSNIGTVSLTINPVNDVAIIGGVDTGVVIEDVDPDFDNLLEVSGALTIIDPDPGEAAFNAGPVGGTYGVITMAANGNWDYAANTNQAAIQALTTGQTLTDTITISSVDGTTHDIVITIMGTNDAPVAGNDVANVNEGGIVIIDVAATDSDIDNALDLNSIAIIGLPANGSVVANGDGTVTYTHNGSETLVDSFSYTISDISGAVSNTAMVSLSINPVNDAPVAGDDVAIVAEGNSVLIDLAANDTDADNAIDLNSVTIVGAPANGTLTNNFDGTVTYTHDGSETLSDTFTYTISDISAAISNTATVNITVTPVNDAPATSGIAGVTVNEDAAASTIDLNAAFSDADNLDSELTYSITGNTNIALFSATGINGATGQLSLGYAADMNGSAQITIRAADPSGLSVDTLFTVTVTPVNDAPVIQANNGMVATGAVPGAITGSDLNVTDVDNTSSEITYTITVLPGNGQLLLNGVAIAVNDTFTQDDLDNNRVVYQAAGTMPTDQFGFTVTDSAGGTLANNTFDITVQLAQDNDAGTNTETVLPPAEEEQIQDEILEDSGGANDRSDGYGGGYVPFGSTSAPQPQPEPLPVLAIEPTAMHGQKPAQPVVKEVKEVKQVKVTEVKTFTAVQLKSMDALWSAIDKMKQEMGGSTGDKMSPTEFKVATAKSSGVVLTAGVVAWILRSGALLSSLMSTIPLWKGYDPLPILAYKDDEEEKEEDEIHEDKIPTSLEELQKLKKLKEKKSRQVDVDSIFDGSAIRE